MLNAEKAIRIPGDKSRFPFYSFVDSTMLKLYFPWEPLARRFYAVIFFFLNLFPTTLRLNNLHVPAASTPQSSKFYFADVFSYICQIMSHYRKTFFFYLFELTCCALDTPRGKCMPFRHFEAACPHHFHSLPFESQSNCMWEILASFCWLQGQSWVLS